MSLSSPKLTNPAHRFFEWSAQAGKLQYYDKEKDERIEVPLPFSFIVLDDNLATITGYSQPDKASYYSNEVRSTDRDAQFIVRIKGQPRYTGPYKNSQGMVQTPKGSKYTKSIYIAYQETAGGLQTLMIGNLKLAVGSALSAWIDFSKSRNLTEGGRVTLTRGDEEEAPTGKYFPPKFDYKPSQFTPPEEYKEALVLDKALQAYLGNYFAAIQTEADEQVERVDEVTPTTTDRRTDLQPTGDPELDSLFNSESNDINPDDLPVSFRNN